MSLIQPYASQHASPKGPGDARPTAEQIIRDQNLINALPDLNILITGCTSGIGIETARALYLTGANIWITARNASKGEQVATDLTTDPTRPVKVLKLSLDSFASIHQAASTLLSQTPTLNILINNAGVMAIPEGKTHEGHELQFGTNHLGHFLLFTLLKPALLAAATPARPSRVVALSSTGHAQTSRLDFSDLDFSQSPYHPIRAYANSKLANIYFANHLTRLYGAQNLVGLSVHPGSIETSLRRFVEDSELVRAVLADPGYQAQLKSVEQGAATTVWAAVGREWMGRGGVYLEDCGEAGPRAEEGALWRTGYSAAAFRAEDEARLWEVSERLRGV